MNSDQVISGRIKELLDSSGIAYREVHHEPTKTSAESAKARGEDLAIGGKTLLLKVGDEFRLFVLSATKRLDSQKIRNYFGESKLRFASPEELHTLTGLVPGAVPPFGRPIVPFDLFVDRSILDNERIAFNAGTLTISIIMSKDDYISLVKPQTFSFSE
jgi:Ala-tRNA(Pro) deacylase